MCIRFDSYCSWVVFLLRYGDLGVWLMSVQQGVWTFELLFLERTSAANIDQASALGNRAADVRTRYSACHRVVLCKE